MDSIFSQLFTYRPSAERSPQEDFFTAALAGVLKASSSLRLEFVRCLTGQETDFVHIETQRTVPGGNRLDIWIEARTRHGAIRHVIAMENKLGAGEGESQLRRYEEHLKSDTTAHTRTLVYATLHERSTFQPSSSGIHVDFQPIHWFDVATWMRRWLAKRPSGVDDRSTVLVCELLQLMKDWEMAMNLNADHLAAATLYRRTVMKQFLQILDEIKSSCGLFGAKGNQWSHNREFLHYSSPWVDEREDIHVEFGFDFDRDDADFSVAHLCVPSAYFAVRGTHRRELDTLDDWGPAPNSWGDDDYLRVKQIRDLRVRGDSLHSEYLGFFNTARDELWRAIGRGETG